MRGKVSLGAQHAQHGLSAIAPQAQHSVQCLCHGAWPAPCTLLRAADLRSSEMVFLGRTLRSATCTDTDPLEPQHHKAGRPLALHVGVASYALAAVCEHNCTTIKTHMAHRRTQAMLHREQASPQPSAYGYLGHCSADGRGWQPAEARLKASITPGFSHCCFPAVSAAVAGRKQCLSNCQAVCPLPSTKASPESRH